jgi:hypothetical protein
LVNFATSQPADALTSKDINLTFLPSDSIALTFYYQARGNGDSPEITDSLLLDYYKPKQNKWQKVWYQRGNANSSTNDTVFKRGFIRVIDTAFLHEPTHQRPHLYCAGLGHWSGIKRRGWRGGGLFGEPT